MSNLDPAIAALVEDVVTQIVAATEAAAAERARSALASAFWTPAKPGRGRPRQGAVLVATLAGRRRPKQLCPVPGCKNPAAPVFGMVCARHKDVPKAKIKEYREARKAKAATATQTVAARKKPRSTAKLARARKLQGQYLGALKSLNAADRAKVKAVAMAKGVPEALKVAATLKRTTRK